MPEEELSAPVLVLALKSADGLSLFFFFQAEDGIRDLTVTGVQTCALPISLACSDLFEAAGDPLIWEQHPENDRYKREVFQRYFDGAIESKGAFAVIERARDRKSVV